MKFCHPDISGVFDTDIEAVNTIVIENRLLFRSVIEDIYTQIDGFNGKAVLTVNDKISDFSKYAELFSSFVPFDINKKSLISKITLAMEKESLNEYKYEQTMKILTDVEKYMECLSSSFNCNISYSKITSSALIKAVGIEIVDDYTSLGEKVIDYMELVREFDREKMFFTVNLRSYISDDEADAFLKTIKKHDFKLIMFESKDYKMLSCEHRRTIDDDLCEI